MTEDKTFEEGWLPRKFIVKHYRRGDLLDGEAFVLVPERDPAAIPALKAYMAATPDMALTEALEAWLEALGELTPKALTSCPVRDRVPSWVATLSASIEAGMAPTTALFRLASRIMTTYDLQCDTLADSKE